MTPSSSDAASRSSKEGGGYPIRLYDGATQGVSVKLVGSELAITPGTGTPYATTVNLGLLPLTWYYLELKVKCADVGGTYELRVSGQTVLSGSGDTKVGSNAYHDRVCFYNANGAIPYFDDFYVCDGSGSANNNFLGDVRVVTVRPSGAGGSTQWTPDSGSNYARVNEAISGEDSNYVEDGIIGHEDRYAFGDLSGVSSINGLMICTDCRETDAKSYNLKTVCQSDVTHNVDAGQSIGSTNYLHGIGSWKPTHTRRPLDSNQFQCRRVWHSGGIVIPTRRVSWLCSGLMDLTTTARQSALRRRRQESWHASTA